MATVAGFPKCRNCGEPIRVERSDAPDLCKVCREPQVMGEKDYGDAPRRKSDGDATTKRSSRR